MKCTKCGETVEEKKDDPCTACPSCGHLALHASPVPKPARVSEKLTRERLFLTIDERNVALGGILLAALIFSFAVFGYLIFHEPQMRKMPEMLKEMVREESILFLLPMLTGLLWPVAALYFALTLMVNRKTLSVEKGTIVRSAAPLPPMESPFRLSLNDIKSIEIEYKKNMGHSLQAVMHRGKKKTLWPADTNPLMVLYLKEQLDDYMEMQRLQEGSPLQQDFSKALDDGDCDRLLTMLDSHPELANGRSSGGRTPLTLAADRGHTACAKMLLGIGAEVNKPDRREHRTALHYACLGGHPGIVELLVTHRADINATDREKATPLHLAKAEGHDDIAKKLMSLGAQDRVTFNVTEPGFPWKTLWPLACAPLLFFFIIFVLNAENVHTAACTGNLKKVKSLVEANPALLNEPSAKLRETPLQEAASAGRLEVVKYLVEKGADVNYGAAHGSSPLERAVARGHRDVVMYLLDRTGTAAKETKPLHAAAENGNMELAAVLIDRGFDVNEFDRSGRTPLHDAVGSDSLEIVKLLIEKGADVNARSAGKGSDGRTPLHYARSDRAVRILVRKGADVNARDMKGLTPLHRAAEGFGSAVEELLALGAEVNARDETGRTPLTCAKNFRYSRKVITEHGGKE